MLPFLKRAAGPTPSSPTAKSTPDPAEAETPRVYTQRGQAVGDSDDLRRILALPRRERPSEEQIQGWADDFKKRFGRHNPHCECRSVYHRPCASSLLPVQAWALHEAETVGGILGPIGVGHGKSLLDLLTPMVVGSKVSVLLLPPGLKRQMLDVDFGFYGQHWHLPNIAGGRWYVPNRPFLHVVAFSELSGAKASDLLAQIAPDCVVVDEAHSVRNRSAARTKRFLRFLKLKPDTKLFSWSGTLTSRSIRDYAHLASHSLREGSPTPLYHPTLEEWAAHLDPLEFRSPAGKLSQLGGDAGDARGGFRDRLVATPGVISSGDTASCQASLSITQRPIKAPEVVKQHLDALERSWQRPDGEELVDALSKARCARELSCGFFYRWRWPRREPVPVIERWLEVRAAWHKELREKLKGAKVHMDSPLLLTKAAIRWEEGYVHVEGERRIEVPKHTRNGPLPTWSSEFWSQWREVRDTAKPETEAVWLDDFLVQDTLNWLREGPGLAWYEFGGFADRCLAEARQQGVPIVYCGPGASGAQTALGLRGSEAALLSIRSHGTGRNLQGFSRNLVCNPPSDGAIWEQLLGRTHRQGQTADEVTFEVYRHTEPFVAAVEKARDLSDYIEGTFGATQRLASVASWGF